MRLLSLSLGDAKLELHPLVTVVDGLDPALRDRLVSVLAALPAGRAEAAGVIEAHGILLDLTYENLEMLELRSDIDVVVRRTELPGAELSPSAREQAAAAARREELLSAIERRRADLDRATLAKGAASEALAEARGEGSEAEADARREKRLEAPRAEVARRATVRADLERLVAEAQQALAEAREQAASASTVRERARVFSSEAAKACAAAAAELEAARGGRDPAAVAALDAARQRVIDLESGAADAELVGADDAAGEDEDPAALVERLEARRALLEASLIALDPIDAFPVEVALRQVENDAGTDLVPSTDAQDMADEWAQLLIDLGATQVSEHDANQVATAHKRLEVARAALFEAEGAARLPDLDREQVDALENAHEAVLQAQEKSEKRLTGDRAKKRLDEARATEQEILDRLGMHTYADFIMGTSMLRVDPEQEERLDAAREELARAEDAIAGLDAEVEAELKHAELMARRRALREQATVLLGRDPGDDDMEWALRHHRVAAPEGGDKSLRLRTELENAGLELGDEDVPRSMLIDLARIWLEELHDTEAQRIHLEEELAELATALDRARHAGDAADDEAATAAELERRRAEKLDEAQRAVVAAEARFARHQEAENETEHRRQALAQLTDIEQSATVDLAAADAEWAAASEVEHAAEQRWHAAEAELATAVAAERAAADALSAAQDHLAHAIDAHDVDELQAALDAAAESVVKATADVNAMEAELMTIEARLHDLEGTSPASGMPTEGELEWYLLARLASQRSVSFAGSVPLVLDDALGDLTGAALVRVLERLERMSGAVQLVVLSDNPAAAAWATQAGPERAGVLRR